MNTLTGSITGDVVFFIVAFPVVTMLLYMAWPIILVGTILVVFQANPLVGFVIAMVLQSMWIRLLKNRREI